MDTVSFTVYRVMEMIGRVLRERTPPRMPQDVPRHHVRQDRPRAPQGTEASTTMRCAFRILPVSQRRKVPAGSAARKGQGRTALPPPQDGVPEYKPRCHRSSRAEAEDGRERTASAVRTVPMRKAYKEEGRHSARQNARRRAPVRGERVAEPEKRLRYVEVWLNPLAGVSFHSYSEFRILIL